MGLSRTKTSEILNCFNNFCCPEVNLPGPVQVKPECRWIARPSSWDPGTRPNAYLLCAFSPPTR